MANIVELTNQALAILHVEATLQAIPDGSAVGKVASLFVPLARQQILRDYPWQFATRTVTLVESADPPPPKWQYRYGYPTDCLAARELLVAGMTNDHPAIPFHVEQTSDGLNLSILTDEGDAQLRYIVMVEDTDKWPPDAQVALRWLLAVEMAPALKVSAAMIASLRDLYRYHLAAAYTNDGLTREDKPMATPSSIQARW